MDNVNSIAKTGHKCSTNAALKFYHLNWISLIVNTN